MIELAFRRIDVWPGKLRGDEQRERTPFRSTWTSTLELLETELRALRVDRAMIQMALRPQDFRVDGSVKANAKPDHPGIILTFEHPKIGPLSYPCDRYSGASVWLPRTESNGNGERRRMIEGWQANVRAVALTLQALRAVDRYGATMNDQQYTGWAQLGPARPMGAADRKMTRVEASEFLRIHSEWRGDWDPVADRVHIDMAYKAAARRLHPDAGGDAEQFRLLNQARDLLAAG